MTVSSSVLSASYTGDGVSVTFGAPFYFLLASDLVVAVNGVVKTLNVDYTVANAHMTGGGSVTFMVAPAAAAAISIVRVPPLTQTLAVQDNETMLARVVNDALDKLTMILQYFVTRTMLLTSTGATYFDALSNRIANLAAPVNPNDAVRLTDLQTATTVAGNVPSPSAGQIGYVIQATAANTWNWVNALSGYLSQTAADARYLQLTGGTITGQLTASGIILKSNSANYVLQRADTTSAGYVLYNSPDNSIYVQASTTGGITTSSLRLGGTTAALEFNTNPVLHTGSITLNAAQQAQVKANIGGSGVLGSVANSTSGTAVDFTGIPSWAKRVTVMLNGVSTNGTSALIAQIGSGSVQSSGYSGTYLQSTNASAAVALAGTTGFNIAHPSAASATITGHLVLTLINPATNTWIYSASVGDVTNTRMEHSTGVVSLSGSLDRVRVTSVTPDTLDAGSINVMWE